MDAKTIRDELVNKGIIQEFKTLIGKEDDNTIRVIVKYIREIIGDDDTDIDAFYEIRTALFDEGIMATMGRTKDNEMVLVMVEKNENDRLPLDKAKEEEGFRQRTAILESMIPGLGEILRMEGFNEFDPDKVVKILGENASVIEKVMMEDEDTIAVKFKEDVNGKDLIRAFCKMTNGGEGLDADTVEFDGEWVEFWWD
jgi:hypothetical protein